MPEEKYDIWKILVRESGFYCAANLDKDSLLKKDILYLFKMGVNV